MRCGKPKPRAFANINVALAELRALLACSEGADLAKRAELDRAGIINHVRWS